MLMTDFSDLPTLPDRTRFLWYDGTNGRRVLEALNMDEGQGYTVDADGRIRGDEEGWATLDPPTDVFIRVTFPGGEGSFGLTEDFVRATFGEVPEKVT